MKMKQVVIALVFCFMAFPALAETPFKMAVVDINKAARQSDAGKRTIKMLNAKAARAEGEIRKKEQEFRAKEAELKNSLMLSAEAKQRKQKELVRLYKELQTKMRQIKVDFRKDEERRFAAHFTDIKDIIAKISREKKYDLVIERGMRKAILFTNFKLDDLTLEVIKRYNKLQTLK